MYVFRAFFYFSFHRFQINSLPHSVCLKARGIAANLSSFMTVIRCPNNCFHNGDCVGTTCFCYKGWTGHDCSNFTCRDVRDCSGRGECVGPNVCRCLPGLMVLKYYDCNSSYCGFYECYVFGPTVSRFVIVCIVSM